MAVRDFPQHDDPIRHPQPFGLRLDAHDVVVVRGVADQHEPRVAVEMTRVDGECSDQVMLALVADDPTYVEPICRVLFEARRRHREVLEVDPNRQDFNTLKSDGEHLPTVEV